MPLISQNSLRQKTLSIMSDTKPWNENWIGFGPLLAKGSSPYLLKSYYNLISETDIYNTCWWTQVHKGTFWAPKRKWKSAVPSKSSKFWFLLVSTFKATSSKLFTINSTDFLTQTAQGRRQIKSKINLKYGRHIFRYGCWFHGRWFRIQFFLGHAVRHF